MIEYQGHKVTAKVKAKHTISDYLMKVFDGLKQEPKEFKEIISSNNYKKSI